MDKPKLVSYSCQRENSPQTESQGWPNTAMPKFHVMLDAYLRYHMTALRG